MILENLVKIFLSKKIWGCLIAIAIIYLCLLIGKIIFNRNIKILEYKKNIRAKTYVNLIYHLYKYIVLILGAVVILKIFGVNITSILASLGIISLIVGLSLQDALKDIIMGFNIMVDSYFKIGNVIEINGVTGKVIDFNLKTTKIRDIYTDNIYVISNRNIDKVLNISNRLDIEVAVEYEKDVDTIEKVLDIIVERSKANEKIKSINHIGIKEFGDSAIIYKIRVNTNPENKPSVKSYVNRIIKEELDKNDISIPYTQIDLHNKK